MEKLLLFITQSVGFRQPNLNSVWSVGYESLERRCLKYVWSQDEPNYVFNLVWVKVYLENLNKQKLEVNNNNRRKIFWAFCKVNGYLSSCVRKSIKLKLFPQLPDHIISSLSCTFQYQLHIVHKRISNNNLILISFWNFYHNHLNTF